MTAASRIVLDPGLRDVVDAIQAKTRCTSPSAEIALMISRYGRHLLETWELNPAKHPDPDPAQFYPTAVAVPVAAPTAPVQSNDFKFTEPIEF